MGDKMLVYGVPESRWGQYFEYGVLTSTCFIRIVKARNICGSVWEDGDRLMVNDSDIIKVGGMVE